MRLDTGRESVVRGSDKRNPQVYPRSRPAFATSFKWAYHNETREVDSIGQPSTGIEKYVQSLHVLKATNEQQQRHILRQSERSASFAPGSGMKSSRIDSAINHTDLW